LTKEESIELLENITGEEPSSSMEALARDLECIPLLMNYAAHYIKATPGCTTEDYLNLFCHHLFEKAGPLWKEMDVNRRYLKSLASSWQFSLKALEKDNPRALEWLYVCSYLYPENIPETWIDDWLSSKEENSGQPFEIIRKTILQALQNYGIIHFQEESRTFSLHRFFLYMIRESRQTHIPEDLRSAYNLLSMHTHDYNYFQSLSWETGKNWHTHACEFIQWMNKYPEYFSDPVSLNNKANFFTALARWNMFNYHFSKAIDDFYQALFIYKSLTNELSPQYAFNHAWIGFSHFGLGHLREALRILSEVEDILRTSINERPLELTSFLDVKGMCHFELHEYDVALRNLQEGLQINLNYQGNQHVKGLFSFDTMTSCLLGNIGRCLRDMGRYEEALNYFERALPLLNKTCGKGHPYYLLYTAEKAYLDIKMGSPKKALQLIQDTLREYAALNGKEFGEQTVVWYVMGQAYLHLNDLKKAREMFIKTRSMSLQYFGEDFFMLRRAYHGMSHVYFKEKNVKKGLKYQLKYLQMCANNEIKSEQMVHILEEFQRTLTDALRVKDGAPYILKASHEAALLTEKILGKDHALTSYFREIPSKIDNSKVKI
jgi:tetratricopeptide (TPR) repeat protein